MSNITFTPAPGATETWRRVWHQALIEASLVIRNGEQLLLALVIPVGLLVGGRFVGDRFGMPMSVLVPSVLALALWSTGFTSLAITTAYERRYGVLERLAATPLGRTGLLLGKALAFTLLTLGQWVVLGIVTLLLGWPFQVTVAGTLTLVLGVPLALVCFVSLGLVLASVLRAEAALATANLIYLLGAFGGGVFVPISAYPLPLLWQFTPTAACGELVRGWASGQAVWWAVGCLLVWATGSFFLARKAFKC